jgi:NAD+ kinase
MSESPLPLGRRPRVVIMALGRRLAARAEVDRNRPLIEQYADIVAVDLDHDTGPLLEEADLAIVFGGDGSILRAAHRMGSEQIPVVGVNLGRLGFLADLLPGQLPEALPAICAGHYRVIEHLMFQCQVIRNGQPRASSLGLNEVAILAGPPFAILDVQLYVDSELATTYSCDGLIVSTPIGSTAHNLSAGGPILRNELEAFVISPISPHTLTNRPVVDAADRTYELVVPHPHAGTSLVVDGRLITTLTAADRVAVKRSEARFQLVEVVGHGYYRRLRDKLGWGGGLRASHQ